MLRRRDHARWAADPVLRLQLGWLPRAGGEAPIELGLKATCAAVYEHPAIRWLLGDELHPGGEATTARALELIGAGPGDRLLDVASGTGSSAMLAARDFGCHVTGLDYGQEATSQAQVAAQAEGLAELVEFVQGDAESLPFAEASFDAVLCECSLCTFPDKQLAVSEMKRVLQPGGRLAISDVVAHPELLPEELRGAMATIACLGMALPLEGYESLLDKTGFELLASERRDDDAAALARRVEDRLRGARVVGWNQVEGFAVDVDKAIQFARLARHAISDGVLGYAIFAAARR